jgi:hypothetical protein
MAKPGQMRHVSNVSLLEFLLKANRQRHEFGDPWDTSRLDRGGRLRRLPSHQMLSAMLRVSDVA